MMMFFEISSPRSIRLARANSNKEQESGLKRILLRLWISVSKGVKVSRSRILALPQSSRMRRMTDTNLFHFPFPFPIFSSPRDWKY